MLDTEGEELGVGPGDVLVGRFRLASVLGMGGMGSVWRAQDLQLGSPVAVKVVRPKVAANSNSRARFLREAKAAARLRSPHVVQILECGEDDGRIFMAMEMLEGESLFERIEREGTIDWPTLATIFVHIGRAMSRAHEAGIVHRDLKPDNIFLVDNDDEILAKVLDFGIAKSEVDGLDLTGESPRTQTGAVLGTPYYMSPEQATAARDVDHRADLWAMGVIAYECLLGTRPYSGGNLGDLVLNICSRSQPVPSHAGDVPPGFDAWFARAQARERHERFQSARELVQALREVLLQARPKASAITQAAGSPRKVTTGTIELNEGELASDAHPQDELSDETTDQPLLPLDTGPNRTVRSPSTRPMDPALETLEAVSTTHAPQRPSWMVGAVAIGLFVVAGAVIAFQVVGEPSAQPGGAVSPEPSASEMNAASSTGIATSETTMPLAPPEPSATTSAAVPSAKPVPDGPLPARAKAVLPPAQPPSPRPSAQPPRPAPEPKTDDPLDI